MRKSSKKMRTGPVRPRLALQLPLLPNDQFYQLAFVGEHWIPSAGDRPRQVTLYFHRKRLADNFWLPVGRWLSRRIHVAETLVLVVGSLWNDEGEMISDGRLLTLPANPGETWAKPEPLKVFDTIRSFTLGPASQVAQLQHVLDLTCLRSVLLGKKGQAWVLLHEEEGIHYLIPCAELLRAFYYVDGHRLADFFAAGAPLDQVCRVLTQPSATNDYAAHVAVVTDGFTPHQLCVLTELCLTKPFLNAAVHAHAQLVLESLRDGTKGVHLQLGFPTDRPVSISANGFEFTHQQKSFFWVCAIEQHQGLWSFRSLTCQWEIDHRSSLEAEPGALLEKTHNPIPTSTVSSSAAPVLDSNQEADVDAGDLTLALPSLTALPEISLVPKPAQQGRTSATRSLFPKLPLFLTQRRGGKSGGGRTRSVRSQQALLALPVFFKQVLDEFRTNPIYATTIKVQLLELNNDKYRKFGTGISVFPHWWKGENFLPLFKHNGEARRLGLACLTYGGGHFYLSQLHESARVAILYQKDLRPLGDHQLNTVLKYLAEANLDWVALRKSKEKQELLRRFLRSELVIKTHNHIHNLKDAAAALTARLCAENMQEALLMR